MSPSMPEPLTPEEIEGMRHRAHMLAQLEQLVPEETRQPAYDVFRLLAEIERLREGQDHILAFVLAWGERSDRWGASLPELITEAEKTQADRDRAEQRVRELEDALREIGLGPPDGRWGAGYARCRKIARGALAGDIELAMLDDLGEGIE